MEPKMRSSPGRNDPSTIPTRSRPCRTPQMHLEQMISLGSCRDSQPSRTSGDGLRLVGMLRRSATSRIVNGVAVAERVPHLE